MAKEQPPQIYNPLTPRPEELLGKYGDDELAQLAEDWRMFLVSVTNVAMWQLQTSSPFKVISVARNRTPGVTRNLPTA